MNEWVDALIQSMMYSEAGTVPTFYHGVYSAFPRYFCLWMLSFGFSSNFDCVNNVSSHCAFRLSSPSGSRQRAKEASALLLLSAEACSSVKTIVVRTCMTAVRRNYDEWFQEKWRLRKRNDEPTYMAMEWEWGKRQKATDERSKSRGLLREGRCIYISKG